MTERIDTTVRPYGGDPQPCTRHVLSGSGGHPGQTSTLLQFCGRPVRFFVWDSLVCADHAEERLVELLEAAFLDTPGSVTAA